MFRINLAWNVIAVFSIAFNIIVIFLAIDRSHYKLEEAILKVDSRYQYVIENYAPYIVEMNTATIPMNMLLLESIYSIVLFTIGMLYAAVKILRAFWKNRRILSERVTNAQKNIVIVLIVYTATFLGLLGFPSIAAGACLLVGVQIKYLPLAPLYFISASIPAVIFCIINLSTVTPYRRALRKLFTRWLPIGSTVSSSATVSHDQNTQVPVPASLFTRGNDGG